MQSIFYTHGGWLDGVVPTALSTVFITRAIQDLIDRGVAPEATGRDDDSTSLLIVFLDDTLSLAGGLGSPTGPHHAHFETTFGATFYYGIVPSAVAAGEVAGANNVERLAATASAVVAAMCANPTPEAGWADLSAQSTRHDADAVVRDAEPAARTDRPRPWPSLYVEHRIARFQLDDEEVERFFDRLASPLRIADIPGAAGMLRHAATVVATVVDARRADQARHPRPASAVELRDFSRPNPRVTIPERFAALKFALGKDHPDVALVEQILGDVSDEAFSKIRRAYFDNGALTFVDVVFWTYQKVKLAKTLGLETGAPLSIWDIGCGGGHFSLVCEHFGHRVIGTDQDHPVYGDIAAALGVDRKIDVILPDTATTNFGRKFELITAIQTEFDRLRPYGYPPRFWSLDQWKFLLNDLMARQLTFPGRVYIALNHEVRDGQGVFNVELMRLCAAHGAQVVERRGIIDWRMDAPVAI